MLSNLVVLACSGTLAFTLQNPSDLELAHRTLLEVLEAHGEKNAVTILIGAPQAELAREKPLWISAELERGAVDDMAVLVELLMLQGLAFLPTSQAAPGVMVVGPAGWGSHAPQSLHLGLYVEPEELLGGSASSLGWVHTTLALEAVPAEDLAAALRGATEDQPGLLVLKSPGESALLISGQSERVADMLRIALSLEGMASGVVLSGATLPGATLPGAMLPGATHSGATLSPGEALGLPSPGEIQGTTTFASLSNAPGERCLRSWILAYGGLGPGHSPTYKRRVVFDEHTWNRARQQAGGLLRDLQVADRDALEVLALLMSFEGHRVFNMTSTEATVFLASDEQGAAFPPKSIRCMSASDLEAVDGRRAFDVAVPMPRSGDPLLQSEDDASGSILQAVSGRFEFERLRVIQPAYGVVGFVLLGPPNAVRAAINLHAILNGKASEVRSFDFPVAAESEPRTIPETSTLEALLTALGQATDLHFLLHSRVASYQRNAPLPRIETDLLAAWNLAEELLYDQELALVELRRSSPRILGVRPLDLEPGLCDAIPLQVSPSDLDRYEGHPALWLQMVLHTPVARSWLVKKGLQRKLPGVRKALMRSFPGRRGLLVTGSAKSLAAVRDALD